jgi:hypothetical protein
MAGRTDLEQLVYVLSADVTQLTKQTERALGIIKKNATDSQHHLDSHPLGWHKFFGHPEEAAKKVFDSSRLAVIEEGSAKLRIFGSALEPLGAAGIAAAAGLAAFGIAAEQAKKAGEFAEGVEKAAEKLGITTDKLQEYDFLALKSAIATDVFREAIQAGTEKFGAFISNVGDAKVKQAFDALHITKDQARDLGTFSDALPVIADRIKAIGNEAEQAQLAKKLGLEAMLPALKRGADYIQETANEAHKLGLVMSSDMIEKGAEFAEQLKISKAIVDHDLMEAFIQLAPFIQKCMHLVEKMAGFAADTATNLSHIKFDPKTGNLTDEVDAKELPSGQLQRELDYAQEIASGKKMGDRKAAAARIARLQPEADRRQDEEQDKEDELRGRRPVGLIAEKGAHTKHNGTAEAEKAAQSAFDEAEKERLSANAALTKNIEAHAEAEKLAIDAELTKKLDSIKATQKKNEADDSLTKEKKAQLRRMYAATAADDRATANAKKLKVDIDAQVALSEQALKRHEKIAGFDERRLSDEAAMASTRAARLRLDLEAFDRRVATEEEQRQTELQNKARQEGGNPDDVVVLADTTKPARDAANAAARARILDGARSPLEKWSADGRKAAEDVGDALQTQAVKGIDQFNDGMAQSIVAGKSLGATMKSIFATMETDLIRYLLKQSEIGIFGSGQPITPGNFQFGGQAPSQGGFGSMVASLWAAIPKFADGGVVGGVGSMRSDSLLARLSPGEIVIPNGIAGAAANLRAMTHMPSLHSSSSVTVIQPHYNDFKGAVVTEDLIRTMDARAHAVATSVAASSQRGTMDRLGQSQHQRLG